MGSSYLIFKRMCKVKLKPRVFFIRNCLFISLLTCKWMKGYSVYLNLFGYLEFKLSFFLIIFYGTFVFLTFIKQKKIKIISLNQWIFRPINSKDLVKIIKRTDFWYKLYSYIYSCINKNFTEILYSSTIFLLICIAFYIVLRSFE